MTSAEDGSTGSSIDESAARSTTRTSHPNSTEASDSSAAPTDPTNPTPAAGDPALGWRGWVLVGATVVAFIGVPLVILFRPPSLPFLVAYLALPLLPAFLLAALAVWVALPRVEG